MPSSQQQVKHCYDLTASSYADKYLSELGSKHLDQLLLRAFVAENVNKGTCIDLGCGPGQTTRFLFEEGMKDVVGVDLSSSMIAEARKHHPGIPFEQADMLALSYNDHQFASAIAFYAIVHFNEEQLRQALKEIYRVLQPGGAFLFSFHIGDETVRVDNFLEQNISLDFQFFKVSLVKQLLISTGFTIIDCIERSPYASEHPTQRAYIWVKKTDV